MGVVPRGKNRMVVIRELCARLARCAQQARLRHIQPADGVRLSYRAGWATDTRYSQGRTRVSETFPVRLRRSTEKNTCSQQTPVSPVRSSIVCAPFRFRNKSIFRSTDSGLEGCLVVDLIVPSVAER